jgi:hypothetical protein
MRKLTIRLTDAEYADLEQRAQNERRTIREMAERLVTAPPTPQWPWFPNTTITKPLTITSGSTDIATECQACKNPSTAAAHTCNITVWNVTSNASLVN